jgi:hypothetical protein
MTEDRDGPICDRDRFGGFSHHHRSEVGDRDGGVGGAEIGRENDSGMRIEREPGRWPAARRPGLTGRGDQTGRNQFVDPGGNGGAGQAGELCEFGPGVPAAVPQELE